jgi:hypothetical protein
MRFNLQENQLIVDDAVKDEVALSFQKMEQLRLCPGDMVLLKREQGRETICTVQFGLCTQVQENGA